MNFWSKAVNILYLYTDKQIETSKLSILVVHWSSYRSSLLFWYGKVTLPITCHCKAYHHYFTYILLPTSSLNTYVVCLFSVSDDGLCKTKGSQPCSCTGLSRSIYAKNTGFQYSCTVIISITFSLRHLDMSDQFISW